MKRKVVWPIVGWLAVIHSGALLAPFYFTRSALAVFFVLSFVTGCLGVTLGYHRLLTHNSFQTYPLVRRILTLFGTLAGQGGVLQWVADHRRHHRFADIEGDPHSPREGFWWAHAAWNFYNSPQDNRYFREYCPDLYMRSDMRTLHRTHVAWHFGLAGLLLALGGVPWLVWGLFARLTFVLHSTWAVNSLSHTFGYRNFNTRDSSTNNWVVALLTFGEGWHNNHHQIPSAANHGMFKYEFDPTFMVIRTLEYFGLAWNVKKY